MNSSILHIYTHKGIELVDANSIVSVEALSSYSKIFLSNNKTILVCKVLHWFEDNLSTTQFVRISRGRVINKNYLNTAAMKNDLKVVLLSGEVFTISRRKKKQVLKSLAVL